jgi:hypothetical protein
LQDGSWDEISGEAFLRKLLSMPIEEAKYNTVSAQAVHTSTASNQHSQQPFDLVLQSHDTQQQTCGAQDGTGCWSVWMRHATRSQARIAHNSSHPQQQQQQRTAPTYACRTSINRVCTPCSAVVLVVVLRLCYY